MVNPLLDVFRKYEGDRAYNALWVRRWICPRFAWAVPTEEAIAAIAALSPIVEMGAGTGYWAWLLRQAGAEVEPFDLRPGEDESNHATADVHWVHVRHGDHRVLEQFPTHTLFLCWPPHSVSMASDCLRTFRGHTLVYIGDDGCATPTFRRELEEGWWMMREIELPQWPGFQDRLGIWKRRERPGA